jgi:hypothetical protein
MWTCESCERRLAPCGPAEELQRQQAFLALGPTGMRLTSSPTWASHAARRGQSRPIDCLQRAGGRLLPIIITCPPPGRWQPSLFDCSIGTPYTRRSQEVGRLGMCCGACNSPLYWFQRFMVANVALPVPSQYLQNSTCGAARCPRPEHRVRPSSSGPFLCE